jgi:hypothetical protein
MNDITRADFEQLRNDMNEQFNELRIVRRQEMVTHIRWLAGLFIVQCIATVGATAGVVGWLLNMAGN